VWLNAKDFTKILENSEYLRFYGDFDLTKVDNTIYSSYRGNFLFKSNIYEFSFYYENYKMRRDGFDLPKPLFNNDIVINDKYVESGSWLFERDGYYNFLVLNSKNNYTYKPKLGILFSERRLFLYDNNRLIFTTDEGLRWEGLNPRILNVTNSSRLIESETVYSGETMILGTSPYLLPWVEGVQGYGIGEWIEIETISNGFSLDSFLISNGFVDFNRPHLYEDNSRIKRLRIDIHEYDISFEAELIDTPQLQKIRLPKSIEDGVAKVRFTILEVYEGTKWDDTCLNLIYPLGDLP